LLQAELDREVLDEEKQHPGRWESFVARPWHVVDQPPMQRYLSDAWILREELGAAMLDAALNGNDARILDNAALRSKGQKALEKHKL
jgi:hypothetical protein